MSTDPHDPSCPQGIGIGRGPSLTHWNPRCANVAVPLTAEIIARIETARIAVGIQRALIAAGYDAGPLGAIEDPRAIAAIEQVQREMGWPVTGEPTDALRKILRLRLWTS